MKFRPQIPLAALLSACAVNEASTGADDPLERRDGAVARRDGGARDAAPNTRRDAAPASRSDASTPSGPTVCAGERPHGCYELSDDSPDGCPEQAPEIPTVLPPFYEWDLCSGAAVGPYQTCVWNGPQGGSASCVCDLGVHWICVYL